jgi:2-oxoglutarate ferredoxin oxidoreductase subunit alpha
MNDSEKQLMKGNEAIAAAAIRAGCRAYYGYPITPQNEISAYMAKHMIPLGRVFIQAESEIAAISMVYGSAAAGARAMTSSSSPGISLKQEGISYAAGADLPAVVVNVCRGGPGLGCIAPSQSDYFQATWGGGHGDYYCIVLAPNGVQECADLTWLAFDLADQYRMPVILLADGVIGQLLEGVMLPPEKTDLPKWEWAVGGLRNRKDGSLRHISSLDLVPEELERKTMTRFARYERIKEREIRYEQTGEDGDLTMVAYGTSARVAMGARQLAARERIKLDLFRPITLWPFPYEALGKIAARRKPLLTVEMSLGQLLEDVKLAGMGKAPVHLLGHCGGVIPTEEEILAKAKCILGGKV